MKGNVVLLCGGLHSIPRLQLLTGCYAKQVSLPQVIFRPKIGLSKEEHTIARNC